MTVTLQNAQGATKAFQPDEVAHAIQQGEWSAPVGTPIPVAVDGQITAVPIEHLFDTLAMGGAVVSQADYDRAQLQAQYGDLGHQIEAGAASAASGLTLGLSDAAIGLAGPGARESVRRSEEANPVTSGVAKVAGALAPIVLSGGAAAPEEAAALGAGELGAAGLEGADAAAQVVPRGTGILSRAGEVLSAPQALVSKAGDAVEAGVRRLLPEAATTTAGKLGLKAASLAARGGAEGAVYGGSDYLGEQALSADPSLDGEKLLTAVGHGALLGAVGGGLLGAGGELGSEVLGRNHPQLRNGADAVLAHHLGVDTDVARTLIDQKLVAATDRVDTLAPRLVEAQEATQAKVNDLQAQLDKAGATGPSLDGLGETFERRVLPHLEPDSPLRAIGDAITPPKVGNTADDLREFLKTPEGQQAFAQAIQKEPSIFQAVQAGKVPPGLIPELAKPTTSFAQAYSLRSQIDSAAQAAESPAVKRGLAQLRDDLDGQIETAQRQAAKTLGSDHEVIKALDMASELQAHLEAAGKAVAAKLAKGDGGSSTFGPMLAAAHLASAGVAGIPAIAAGMASKFAIKEAKARAPFAAAVLMDKLATMGAVQKATASVNRQVNRGVNAAMGREATAVKVRDHGLGTYEDKAEAVKEAAENLAAHADRIEQATASLAAHAPATAQAFVTSALKATLYLASVLPKTTSPNPLMPHLDPEPPTDFAKAEFSRVFDAVHSPASVLEAVGKGTVTPQEVAAVQATHPKLKAQMDARLLAEMRAATEPLALTTAIGITTFLGQPADPILTPSAIQMFQGNPAFQDSPSAESDSQGGQTHKLSARVNIASQTALTGQRLALEDR